MFTDKKSTSFPCMILSLINVSGLQQTHLHMYNQEKYLIHSFENPGKLLVSVSPRQAHRSAAPHSRWRCHTI